MIRDSLALELSESTYFINLECNPKWNHLLEPNPTAQFILDDSAAHDLHPVPTFIASAGYSMLCRKENNLVHLTSMQETGVHVPSQSNS